MIRGGARGAARIREQSTEEGEQIEGEEGVDYGNRPSMYSQSPHPSHMWASLSPLRDLAFIRRVVGAGARTRK